MFSGLLPNHALFPVFRDFFLIFFFLVTPVTLIHKTLNQLPAHTHRAAKRKPQTLSLCCCEGGGKKLRVLGPVTAWQDGRQQHGGRLYLVAKAGGGLARLEGCRMQKPGGRR